MGGVGHWFNYNEKGVVWDTYNAMDNRNICKGMYVGKINKWK